MSKNYYLGLWQFVRVITIIWVIVLMVILATLYFDKSLGSQELIAAPLMTAFACALAEICRRWFNFMAGEQICKWGAAP